MPSARVTIRPGTPADAPALHELAAATFESACPPGTLRSDIDAHISTTLSEERMTGYLSDPDRMLFLAEAAGMMIGYTMLVFEGPADPDVVAAVRSRPTSELSKCYLRREWHGSGSAHRLIDVTVSAAETRGAASVWLGVNAQNLRADRFYERNGFERVGTRRYLVGATWHDDIVRERLLE